MARVRLFGRAAQAAGTALDDISAETVGGVLEQARVRYGEEFVRVAATCRVWLNGTDVWMTDPVRPDDEVALLPPVSGG